MSYAFVKIVPNSSNSNVTTFSPTSGGDFLIAIANTSSGAGTPTASIADNLGSSWQTAYASANVGGQWNTIFYLPNCGAGITTITYTFNGGTPGTCSCATLEYSGLATVSALIVASIFNNITGIGTGTDAIVAPTINISSQPAMLWGMTCNNNNHTQEVAGTGFSRRDSGSIMLNNGILMEDKRVTGTGNTAASWTDPTNGATDSYLSFNMAIAEAALTTQITPTVGAISVNGVAPSVTPAQNTKITPFVARKSGLLVPDDRVLVPSRKVFLPTYKRAA